MSMQPKNGGTWSQLGTGLNPGLEPSVLGKWDGSCHKGHRSLQVCEHLGARAVLSSSGGTCTLLGLSPSQCPWPREPAHLIQRVCSCQGVETLTPGMSESCRA